MLAFSLTAQKSHPPFNFKECPPFKEGADPPFKEGAACADSKPCLCLILCAHHCRHAHATVNDLLAQRLGAQFDVVLRACLLYCLQHEDSQVSSRIDLLSGFSARILHIPFQLVRFVFHFFLQVLDACLVIALIVWGNKLAAMDRSTTVELAKRAGLKKDIVAT